MNLVCQVILLNGVKLTVMLHDHTMQVLWHSLTASWSRVVTYPPIGVQQAHSDTTYREALTITRMTPYYGSTWQCCPIKTHNPPRDNVITEWLWSRLRSCLLVVQKPEENHKPHSELFTTAHHQCYNQNQCQTVTFSIRWHQSTVSAPNDATHHHTSDHDCIKADSWQWTGLAEIASDCSTTNLDPL
jgi:hypothetical protein